MKNFILKLLTFGHLGDKEEQNSPEKTEAGKRVSGSAVRTCLMTFFLAFYGELVFRFLSCLCEARASLEVSCTSNFKSL